MLPIIVDASPISENTTIHYVSLRLRGGLAIFFLCSLFVHPLLLCHIFELTNLLSNLLSNLII